jgi:hypothetical protein
VILIVAAIAGAVAIQFLGGGLVEIADMRETAPGPGGNGGGIVLSVDLKARWLATIPVALSAGGLVCLIIRGHERRTG